MALNKTLNQSKNLSKEPTNIEPSASPKSPRNINLFSNHSLSSLFALSSAWSSSLCSRILFNTSSLASCNLKKNGRLDDKTKSIKHNAYKWKWNNGLKLIIINYNNQHHHHFFRKDQNIITQKLVSKNLITVKLPQWHESIVRAPFSPTKDWRSKREPQFNPYQLVWYLISCFPSASIQHLNCYNVFRH